MKSWRSLILLCVLLVPCTGCVQFAALVDLNANGSGRIFLRYLVSEQLEGGPIWLNPKKADESAVAKPATKSATKSGLVEQLEANGETMAKRLGEGVKLVKSERIEEKSGWKGIQFEYRFADINKVSIPFGDDAFPKTTKTEKAKDSKETKESASLWFADRGPLFFRYQTGVVNELVAFHRKRKPKPAKPADPFEAAGLKTKKAPASKVNFNAVIGNTVGKMFMQGFRVTAMTRVDGKVIETNAVDQPKSNSVILMDFDMTPFASDKRFDRAVNEKWDMERMLQEKVPGLRALPRDEEIRIRWKSE
ncbi:MAG: hypothetical protein AAF497_05470 [Planctomycetota bacterium]